MVRLLPLVLCCSLFACGDDGGEAPGDSGTAQDMRVDGSLGDDGGVGDDGGTGECVPSRAAWDETVRAEVEENCGRCHGATPDFGAPFTLLDYDAITAGEIGMRVVDLMHVRIEEDAMPPVGAARPSLADRDTIASWASCGATRITEMGGPSRPPFVAPDEPPMGLETIDVVADNAVVGSSVLDRYDEHDFTNLTAEDVFIRRFEAIVDESRVLHHLTLRRGNPADPAGMKYLYAWAPGTNAVEFPSGGIRLRPTDTLRLQLHYNNGAGLAGITDSSGVRLYVGPSEGDEYIMFDPGPGAGGFSIPARTGETVESTCTVVEPMRALASMPHMHEIGDTFDVLHAPGGSNPESILALPSWSFESQIFYELPVSFAAGDAITVRCHYENPTGERVVAGARTQDEMCFAFTYVTPPPAGGVVCRPGGGATECDVDISPSSGTAETDFAISWDSDGTDCTWQLDGNDQGPIGCAGMTEARLPVGDHVIRLDVTGPGGSHSCQATAVVTAGGPTCNASISPTVGDTSTTFTTTWMSDGTSCTWDLDGVPQGNIECSGSVMNMYPSGTHTVTLHATGPAGTTSCTSPSVAVSG